MWARAKYSGTIWTNATGRLVSKPRYLCAGTDCMCWYSCPWRRQVCSWAENSKWNFLFSDVFVWSTLLNMYAKYGKIMKDVWEDAISKCGARVIVHSSSIHFNSQLSLHGISSIFSYIHHHFEHIWIWCCCIKYHLQTLLILKCLLMCGTPSHS